MSPFRRLRIHRAYLFPVLLVLALGAFSVWWLSSHPQTGSSRPVQTVLASPSPAETLSPTPTPTPASPLLVSDPPVKVYPPIFDIASNSWTQMVEFSIEGGTPTYHLAWYYDRGVTYKDAPPASSSVVGHFEVTIVYKPGITPGVTLSVTDDGSPGQSVQVKWSDPHPASNPTPPAIDEQPNASGPCAWDLKVTNLPEPSDHYTFTWSPGIFPGGSDTVIAANSTLMARGHVSVTVTRKSDGQTTPIEGNQIYCRAS